MNPGSLLEMKDRENALRAFKQASHLAPEDSIVLLNSAACLVNCAMRKEAAELLNRFKELRQSRKVTTVTEEVGGGR